MTASNIPPETPVTPVTPVTARAGTRYAGPPTPQALAERLGIPVDHLCKLDANESPYGPPPAALDALATLERSGLSLLGLGRYPDPSAAELRAALADGTGVSADCIVVGNGSGELINLLVELVVAPGDEVVVAEPTFSLYALASRRRGAEVVDAGREVDFTVTPERIVAAMTPRTRAVFLCSPNNPTGTALARETLTAALERADALKGERGGPLVVVDEAYYEIGDLAGEVGAWTSAPLVARTSRLVVLRTFSKLFGLAGLRVGYALCAPELAERLRALKQPYDVNVAGQMAARAALEEREWLRGRALALVAERERVVGALGAFTALRVWPSAANFVFVGVRTPPPPGASQIPTQEEPAAQGLWNALLERGVMVRRFTDARLSGFLRVSTGTPEQNDRLLAALRAVYSGDPACEGGPA